jgi:two-component system, NarL family, response regulator LiaR
VTEHRHQAAGHPGATQAPPGPAAGRDRPTGLIDAASSGRRIRAIVVDDDPEIRRAVHDSLQEAGVVVIAQASDGREGVELVWHYKPDVVVLDVFMPGVDGVTAMQRIHERLPEARCIMLSVSSDPELGVMALRAGAAGFLTKGSINPASLARIIRGALEGEVAASPKLVADVVAELRRVPQGGIGMRPVRSILTAREWEVLDLISLGHSTRQIAEQLVLSNETVRTHVKNLMRKLGARTRAHAVAIALSESAIEINP